jgi:hypothetical protein
MFSDVGKVLGKRIPDLLLDGVNRNWAIARLPKNRRRDPALFQPGGEPFHLRGFSAAFERDQRHAHDFAAKGSHCRTPHFRLVRLASEGEV